jgi:hypothetical protein
VPHLRDGFIVANRGPGELARWGELRWVIFAAAKSRYSQLAHAGPGVKRYLHRIGLAKNKVEKSEKFSALK